MTIGLTPTQVLAGLSVLMMLAWTWRASARRARAAADAARAGSRLMSMAGRVLFTAGLIVGIQWVVITRPSINGWVVLAVLGLPALFTSYSLTRALTVTSADVGQKRGERR